MPHLLGSVEESGRLKEESWMLLSNYLLNWSPSYLIPARCAKKSTLSRGEQNLKLGVLGVTRGSMSHVLLHLASPAKRIYLGN